MKKIIIIILFTNSVLVKVQAQQNRNKVFFSHCLNQNISESFFINKFIVLDFWQTWCKPCISSFEETNKLIEQYSNPNIVFVNITNEQNKIQQIKNIFKRFPFNGYQLIDDKNKTFQQFKIPSFPFSVILGKKGEILWSGHPVELTDRLIFKETGIKSNYLISEKNQHNFKLDINESNTESSLGSYISVGKNLVVVKYSAMSLKSIISNLHNFSSVRIITNNNNLCKKRINIYGEFDAQKYSVCEINNFIDHALQLKFRYKLSDTLIIDSAWFLTIENRELLNKNLTKEQNSSSNLTLFEINYNSFTLKDAFMDYEKNKNIIFITDSLPKDIINKKYNLQLKLNIDKLQEDLYEQYGLKLYKKSIDITKLKIEFYD